MKLIYLGTDLDTDKEQEIFPPKDAEFGFIVHIKMTEQSWCGGKEYTIYNCTEVHHLWSKDYMGGASIAFESDIHKTGFTRRIKDVECVTIELAHTFYSIYAPI